MLRARGVDGIKVKSLTELVGPRGLYVRVETEPYPGVVAAAQRMWDEVEASWQMVTPAYPRSPWSAGTPETPDTPESAGSAE